MERKVLMKFIRLSENKNSTAKTGQAVLFSRYGFHLLISFKPLNFLLLIALASTFGGCLASRQVIVPVVPPTASTIKSHIIYAPTTWSGDVRIAKPIIVTKGATLKIREGTRIFFDIPEPAKGETRDPWVLVHGAVTAVGTPQNPILFTSTTLRNSADFDDMFAIRDAKEANFQNCTFELGPWGIHIHDTPTIVYNCTFRDNFGGMRFKGNNVEIRGNSFTNNKIGIRCLMGGPVIEENTFTANLTGIFFREGIANISLKRNNFYNDEYDLKMGENQTADVDASDNWWRAMGKGKIEERIYDVNDSPGVGRVIFTPALADPWGTQDETSEDK